MALSGVDLDSSDYRGLKKRITAVRLAQEQTEDITPPDLPAAPVLGTEKVHTRSRRLAGSEPPTLSPQASFTDVGEEGYEPDKESDHHEERLRMAVVRCIHLCRGLC